MVNGFNILSSGHILSGLLNVFLVNLLIFFFLIHLLVNGFNTLSSGHILSGLVFNILFEFFLTYITSRLPLLKEKHNFCIFMLSNIHFLGFKQKSLLIFTFQLYFINSQGMWILFLNNSVGKLSGYLLSDSLTIFPVGIWK